VAAFTMDKILGLSCTHKDGIADGPSGARPFGWDEVSWKEMPARTKLETTAVNDQNLPGIVEWEVHGSIQ